MAATGSTPQIISATTYTVQIAGVNVATFSELAGIKSEVESIEYISSTTQGKINHQKLYGKTSPPEVTLKRGLDNSMTIWAWHMRVRDGDPTAPTDCTLQLNGPDGKPQVTYILHDAWPKKLDITGAPAGKDLVYETVTLVCNKIEGKSQ